MEPTIPEARHTPPLRTKDQSGGGGSDTAAVAGAIGHAEDGTCLQTKDGAVDVGLAQQNQASFTDSGWENCRAVYDDIEILEQLQRVIAGQLGSKVSI